MSDENGLSIKIGADLVLNEAQLKELLTKIRALSGEAGQKIVEDFVNEYNEQIKQQRETQDALTYFFNERAYTERSGTDYSHKPKDDEKFNGEQYLSERNKEQSKNSEKEEYGGFEGNRFNKLAKFLSFVKNYDSDDEEDQQQGQKYVVKAMHQSADIIKSGLKAGFDIVGDIYDRMKAASPLLQAIESLFNIAMQLFFLPLGNKLAEVLIPSVLELLDNVVMLWDSFEGKTLPEMFEYAFSYGVGLFGRFFTDIGDKLVEQGGLLGGIGTSINMLGEFIQGPGVTVLTNILKIINTVLANLKYFIGAWVSLKAIEFSMEAANAFGILSGKSVTASVGALTAIGLGAGLATVGGLSAIGMAEGGYVEPKEGGTLRILAESGEGEYVVPESKVQTFINTHQSSNTTDIVHSIRSQSVTDSKAVRTESSKPVYITYNINGYTDSELKNIILDTVTEQVLKASYKG